LDIAKRKYQCGAGTQKASGSGITEQRRLQRQTVEKRLVLNQIRLVLK